MHVYFFYAQKSKPYKQCKTINILVFEKQQAEDFLFFYNNIFCIVWCEHKSLVPVWIL